jgi:hypothetical protein
VREARGRASGYLQGKREGGSPANPLVSRGLVQRPAIPPPAPVQRTAVRFSSLALIVRSTTMGSDVIPPGVPLKDTAKRYSNRYVF